MAVVLITGCSTGIGRSTSLHLARHGHRVIATMRTPDRSDLSSIALTEQLDLEVLAADVTDDASVRAAVDHVVGRAGRIDAAINNAGVGPFAPIERATDHDWFTTFDTNVFGAARVARAVMPIMRAQGDGLVINISSIAGRLAPVPTQGVYAASKHAVCSLTDSIASEGAPFGVRAICIEPGFFSTAIMDKDTVARLDEDDPYHAVQTQIEDFFRQSVAAAPPPDVVADLVRAAVEGALVGAVHHAVGFGDATPTVSSARFTGPS